jgi:hypothetical protein
MKRLIAAAPAVLLLLSACGKEDAPAASPAPSPSSAPAPAPAAAKKDTAAEVRELLDLAKKGDPVSNQIVFVRAGKLRPDAAPRLLDAAESGDGPTQGAALYLLSIAAAPEWIPEIRRRVLDSRCPRRPEFLRGLATLDLPAALEIARSWVPAGPPAELQAALDILARSQEPADAERIRGLLSHPAAGIRFAAGMSLLQRRDSEGLRGVLGALLERLEGPEEPLPKDFPPDQPSPELMLILQAERATGWSLRPAGNPGRAEIRDRLKVCAAYEERNRGSIVWDGAIAAFASAKEPLP